MLPDIRTVNIGYNKCTISMAIKQRNRVIVIIIILLLLACAPDNILL